MSGIEEQIRKIIEKGKQYIGIIILIFVTLTVFLGIQNAKLRDVRNEEGVDVYEELIKDKDENDIHEEESIEEENEGTYEEIPLEIVVDVKGAVVRPGVYEMEPRSRIVDAIDKAGGFIDKAKRDAVNLAQIVEDQMVIYVPEVGEEGFEINTGFSGIPTANNTKDEDSLKININTADKNTLMTLNGIGNSKAENILSYREENGKFKSIEEIKNVSGIGEATFNQLKDVIVISP